MFYVGVDACKGGWFAVKLDDKTNWSVSVFKTIDELWQTYKHAKLILIDIPIGLRDGGTEGRVCDIVAHHLLGVRRSSVFRVPCRAAIYADTYKDANKVNDRITGKKISKHTWGIVPKIREVDEFLRSEKLARSRIREIHPEVCFWALNGKDALMYGKKEHEGYSERLEILRRVFPYTDAVVKCAQDACMNSRVAEDDILDALVAAVTASKERQVLSTIPEKPETDSKGLPMEMVYFTSLSLN
jgi:predicted RNase H-like nuclease